MKKLISLALCLALTLGLTVGCAGAAYFSDDASIRNSEAVENCGELGIIEGYWDGSFRPNKNVSRAEMCKMMATLLNGGGYPSYGGGGSTFYDVKSEHWANLYVEYCVDRDIVAGVGGGKFDPDGNVTGTQAAKMLLVILGFDPVVQGYVGSNAWNWNINADAIDAGLYKELSHVDPDVPLTRDDAAQMIWNALTGSMVEWEKQGSYINIVYLNETLLAHCYPNFTTPDTPDVPDIPDTPDIPDVPDTPDKITTLADYAGMTRSEIAQMWGSDYTEEQGGDMGADSTLYYEDWRVPAEFSLVGDTVAAVFCCPSDMGSGFTLIDTITGKESYTQLREKGITGRFVTEDNDPDGDLCWNYEETAFFDFTYKGKFFYFSWLNDDPYTSPANFLFVGDADEMVN